MPPKWLDAVHASHSDSTVIAPRKGRVSYAALPGELGEAARHILAKTLEAVNAAREADEPLDMKEAHTTLQGLVEKENFERQVAQKPLLPHKLSVGWAYTMSVSMGLPRERKTSTEANEELAERTFKHGFNDCVRKHQVPPALWLSHDEFNEFSFEGDTGRKVLITQRERADPIGDPGGSPFFGRYFPDPSPPPSPGESTSRKG